MPRPRDPRTDERILLATQMLFAAGGYERTSVDAVAQEAGVTRPTVYRRFGSKNELIHAAIRSVRFRSGGSQVSGDLRGDLVWQLRDLQVTAAKRRGMAMTGAVLIEEEQRPELLELFREHVARPRREQIRALLAAAAERGEIRADADLEMVAALLVGAWYATYIGGEDRRPDWAERTVDILLCYLCARAPAGPTLEAPVEDGRALGRRRG
jgi:AcrR family transcriptional regulator